MHVDVRRGLVFFDRSDRGMNFPSPTRYDPWTGRSLPVAGARHDDVVSDVSRDGGRLVLHSADPLAVRGTRRSRITFLAEGVPPRTTDRFLSNWSVLDPGGRRALVGTINGKGRPVVLDTAAGEVVATMAGDVGAAFGEADPVGGRLWAPDFGAENALLSVDCATGRFEAVTAAVGGPVTRVRFTRDAGSLLIVGERGTLSRHDRDGSVIWSRDMSGIGRVGAGDLFLNAAGSHVLLSLWETRNSEWGEDLVIELGRGQVERSITRHRGPPSRLAADWFGDGVLTYAGEIVDFFSGEVVGGISPESGGTA